MNRMRVAMVLCGALMCSGMGMAQAKSAHDKMFLKAASEGGLAEVKLGELASQKGNSEDVKNFGKQMVTDHSKLNEDMKPLVVKYGLTPPDRLNAKDQAEWNKLDRMQGEAFDKEYISYMKTDHHKDLADFRAEAKSTKDDELKGAVEKGTGVIEHHTMMVDELAQKMGVRGSVPKKS